MPAGLAQLGMGAVWYWVLLSHMYLPTRLLPADSVRVQAYRGVPSSTKSGSNVHRVKAFTLDIPASALRP
jgi:hypothetical protein